MLVIEAHQPFNGDFKVSSFILPHLGGRLEVEDSPSWGGSPARRLLRCKLKVAREHQPQAAAWR